jgi:Coenzyme PQQ synthesis protein D (PqqD)
MTNQTFLCYKNGDEEGFIKLLLKFMFVPEEDNPKMKDTRKPLARCENIVVQEMPEETLVYDLNTNKAFCLNQTAALVWKNCDGQKNVTEIAQILQSSMKSSVSDDLVVGD